MNLQDSAHYDVVIAGGGPGGSTLAALLTRGTDLRVAVLEKEHFPREHIGESFAHPLIPVLEESGALEKVLASDCWVKKFGGIFNWDDEGPSVTFFDHANVLIDGVPRWAMHVNRAEFDHILLQHARDCGAEVFEGVAVKDCTRVDDHCVVTTRDGSTVTASWFVDASGRHNGAAQRRQRDWLSSYRNLAIWQHFEGCKRAQTLEGDWNIFRAEDKSPIGCFAFRDGWFWFIPIPRTIDGERRVVHSIGMVTNPEVLKQPGHDYTDIEVFTRGMHEVPMLRDLVADARPLSTKMLTATNYSMISERFSNFDERWILVGDSSYFVDPLFSSGVAFAAAQASAASLLLKAALGAGMPALPEPDVRDLFRDYDAGWRGMAETFSLSIDQWYHAIRAKHPDGAYWGMRGTSVDLGIREQTFQALLDTAFTPDLLQVITKGTRRMDDLDEEGPFLRARGLADPGEPSDDSVVSVVPGAEVREGVTVDVPGFKASTPPPPYQVPPPLQQAVARYWSDPVRFGDAAPSPHAAPLPCLRFTRPGGGEADEVRAVAGRDGAEPLWALLTAGPVTYGELRARIDDVQAALLKKLWRAGVVRVGEPATAGAADGELASAAGS